MPLKNLSKQQLKIAQNIIKSSEVVTHFKEADGDFATQLATKQAATQALNTAKEIVLNTKRAVKDLTNMSMFDIEKLTVVVSDDEWYTVYPTRQQALKYAPSDLKV